MGLDVSKHTNGMERRGKDGITKTKVVTVIPCWRRPEVTDLCFQNLQWFTSSVKTWDVKAVAVISPDDPSSSKLLTLCSRYGVRPVFYRNLPLGEKMNAGIHWVFKNMDFDYFMNLGSDDLIHPSIEGLYEPYIKATNLFFGIDNLWFWELNTGECHHFRAYNDTMKAIGAGRMIHRGLLKSFFDIKVWPIYSNDKERGLDTDSSNNIQRATSIRDTVVHSGEFPYIVDIKTNTNINHIIYIKSLKDRIKPMDSKELKRLYPHLPL